MALGRTGHAVIVKRALSRATNVLVTGAEGYIGGRLVMPLVEAGHRVHALVREPAPRLGVEQTVCDLTREEDGDALSSACKEADTIVHLAGENEVLAARQPAAALAATVMATGRLVEAASQAGVRRLVYMSTVHVYGQRMSEGAVLSEDLRPEPRSSYAISRLASEHLVAMLDSEPADVVVFRLTNSVGAPEHPDVDRWTLVANDLCRQGVSTGRLELRSSGIQWRDFVALRDVCAIIAEAARVDDQVLPPGTYNLGSGQPTTVRELAGMIQDAFERLTGTRPELHAPQPGPERLEPYHVAIEALARHGLRAGTPLEQSVEETVRFCLDHQEELP